MEAPQFSPATYMYSRGKRRGRTSKDILLCNQFNSISSLFSPLVRILLFFKYNTVVWSDRSYSDFSELNEKKRPSYFIKCKCVKDVATL